MVNATPLPILSDNYVWILSNPESRRVVVVDPGEAAPVDRYLDEHNLECTAILLTHHHRDHVGGAVALRTAHRCPVFGPAGEDIIAVTFPVEEASTVDVAQLHFEVLEVPGHTRGHIAFLGHGILLCGDTLFAGGCGRLFEGSPEQMYDSLSRLKELDPDTAVCCAHEYTEANLAFAAEVDPTDPALHARREAVAATRAAGRPTVPSQIRDELETNPFLRCREPAVVEAASRHAGRQLEPGVEVFTEIRKWKDGFRSS